MAQILQTTKELELFFCNLVVEALNVDKEKVSRMFLTLGQPAYTSGETMVYVAVERERDERDIFKNRSKKYESENKTFVYTQQSSRTLTVHFVAYGPESGAYLAYLNEYFYFDETKYQLRKNYLNLVPDRTDGPIRLMEQTNSQWWERWDLKLRFYNTVSVENVVHEIESLDIRLEVNQ